MGRKIKRTTSKRRTSKRSKFSPANIGQRPFFRLIKRIPRFVKRSPVFPCVALMLLVFSTSTDYFIVLEGRNNVDKILFDPLIARYGASLGEDAISDAIQGQLQGVLYLFIFALSLFYIRELLRLFWSFPVLVVIPVYIALTSFQSDDPQRVMLNVVLITGAIVISAMIAINLQGKRKGLHTFFLIIFFPLFVHQLCSVALYFSLGLDIPQFLADGKRSTGITHNPNNMANHAVIGIWAALCLVFSVHSSKFIRYLCMLSLFVFALNILMAGSGTGLLIMSLVVSSMIALNFFSRFSSSVQILVGMGAVLFAMSIAIVAALQGNPDQLLEVTAESLGKDATLTGRTDVWEIALEAIAEKPFFGWSYDNHATVLSVPGYSIGKLKNFHNGILDTVVAGGLILIALVFVCFWKYISLVIKRWSTDQQAYFLVVAFMMLIGLNLTEYQLLRPNSQVWLVFLCLLSYLIASSRSIDVSTDSRAAINAHRKNFRKRRRSGRSQYRW